MLSKKYLTKAVAVFFVVAVLGCNHSKSSSKTLKSSLNNQFLIGVAMNQDQILGSDTVGVKIIKEQFNSIVGENCMKSAYLQPIEGQFHFGLADSLVDFGEKNHMKIIGHTLIWHSQAPKWFFIDSLGNDVSKEVLVARMKSHISNVVGHYKGRVNGWDVVNEAILDDGSWRETKFYKIIGSEYVKLAFQFAHEADPNAELYYNDYAMANEGKRNGVVKMVKELQQQGIKVDGIGMQGHCTMDFPTIAEYEKSILAFANLDVKVMVTELDITILPSRDDNKGADVALNYEYQKSLNPYPVQLPDSVAAALQNRYLDLFRLFIKHADKIDRVTLWGLSDAHSWRNDWPIAGRTDYPLLYDRNYQPKPIVDAIISEAEKNINH